MQTNTSAFTHNSHGTLPISSHSFFSVRSCGVVVVVVTAITAAAAAAVAVVVSTKFSVAYQFPYLFFFFLFFQQNSRKIGTTNICEKDSFYRKTKTYPDNFWIFLFCFFFISFIFLPE